MSFHSLRFTETRLSSCLCIKPRSVGQLGNSSTNLMWTRREKPSLMFTFTTKTMMCVFVYLCLSVCGMVMCICDLDVLCGGVGCAVMCEMGSAECRVARRVPCARCVFRAACVWCGVWCVCTVCVCHFHHPDLSCSFSPGCSPL